MNRKIRYGTLLLGLIIAVAIVLSNLFSYSVNPSGIAVKKQNQEQTSDQDSSSQTQTFLSLSSSSLPSSFHLEVSVDVIFLFEILFTDLKFEDIDESLAPTFNSSLSNLLGLVISPNAP